MEDGSDGIADWPLLTALINCAAGADIVSVHGGAGASLNWQSTNNHVVLDGSKLAHKKARRVFTADPGMGVARHADAGYEAALEEARDSGLSIPMDSLDS